jgi:urease accessory protein
MQGAVELGFDAAGAGGTRLVELGQRVPLRVLLPADPAVGLPTAVLITTSGGLAGGDALAVRVRVGRAAGALVTSQAAEKVYRSTGPACRIDIDLDVGADAWLEWLPQETILFDRSRLVRATRVALAAGARLLAGEMLVFGRRAMGETLTTGLLRDTWRIHRGGRLAWHDALALDGDIAALVARPAGFAAAAAAATLLYAADDAEAHLATAQGLADAWAATAEGVRAAATHVNGLLLLRASAADPRPLRDGLMHAWRAMRAAVRGLPPAVPRVWLT